MRVSPAGIQIDWNDIAELSAVAPMLARVYPNGADDVNHFQAAGGLGFVVRELLDAGLIYRDILTVHGEDLSAYALEPWLDGDELAWRDPGPSGDETILRGATAPFAPEGGMRLVEGSQRLPGFSGDERTALVVGLRLLDGLARRPRGNGEDPLAALRSPLASLLQRIDSQPA